MSYLNEEFKSKFFGIDFNFSAQKCRKLLILHLLFMNHSTSSVLFIIFQGT